MQERLATDERQKEALMQPGRAIHFRLDAMGSDNTDTPCWRKKEKKQKTRLPCRVMGATISGKKYEHVACLITNFNKEVSVFSLVDDRSLLQ